MRGVRQVPHINTPKYVLQYVKAISPNLKEAQSWQLNR